MTPYGKSKSTISQVARLAGVSVTTVSMYLSGNGKVCSPETGARIRKAVESLNYQPNPLAGWNFNKRRRTIGILASDDLERGNRPGAVFNSRFLNGIFEVADEVNYSILVYPHRTFIEQNYRAALDGRVDGVLFYGSCMHEIVAQFRRAKMPVVCFGIPEDLHNAAGSVYTNEKRTSEWAVKHLISQGHKRIAHLAGPYQDCYRHIPQDDGEIIHLYEPSEQVSRARLDGAIEFLEAAGLYDPELISDAHPWQYPEVSPSLEKWMATKDRPTAIYCANDFIGWKAIEWAWKHGLRVPEDLAIIGVDNIESPYGEPFLSSIQLCVEDVGRHALKLLLDVLEDSTSVPQTRVIDPMFLVERKSTIGQPANRLANTPPTTIGRP